MSRSDFVSYFVQLSMKELRRRQNLCELQIVIAYQKKNSKALLELNMVFDSLTEAVMIKNNFI